MKKKLLTVLMVATMAISMTACGKEDVKKGDNETVKSEDVGGSEAMESENTEKEEAKYITMSPDQVVDKLEEVGFVYSYCSTSKDDANKKTHTLEYKTDEAYCPAWIKYNEDTGELTNVSIFLGSNSEEDIDMYNKLITMFFVDEADKQEFIDFVYKKDVREGLSEKIEIGGLSCSRQNMNVENSTENGYKYQYNVYLHFEK